MSSNEVKDAVPTAAAQNGQIGPSYQCKYCQKTFARAEHLTRHERSRMDSNLESANKRHFRTTLCLSAMQACLSSKVISLQWCLTSRDVLARHKRLVHTKPEDREPPKKRGRPPKSSYVTEGAHSNKDSTAKTSTPATSTATPEVRWSDVQQDASERSAQSAFHFPKLDGEPQNGTFLSNPFNDNFGFGPIDTLSEFNFAEQDILSFLNPSRAGRDSTIYDPTTTNTTTVTNHSKPVILQPDFVDWLQMNRDDYSFSMQQSSPRGLEGAAAPADLIEPNETKEVLVNPASPNTSISIDEQTYAELQENLRTKYKVRAPQSVNLVRKM